MVESGPLPRKARPYADRLVFVERVEPSTEQLEDQETARLVSRIQAGAPDLFPVLYMRYFDRVYGYLRTILNDPHEAEDASQHVFMQVLEALPRYERRKQPFRAWLFIIARNHALYRLRGQQRVQATPPEDISLEREIAVESGETEGEFDWLSDRELLMFVERLPLPQRQVLVLRFMLGLGTAEIASVLERSTDDVRMLQSRALRFLRERLSAVGRGSAERPRPARARRYLRQAPVLRSRRFALTK
jgi:RNA polymerase sigma-70 factor (ECF subfamily)